MKLCALDLSLRSAGVAAWVDGAVSFETLLYSQTPHTLEEELLRLKVQTERVGEWCKGADLALVENFSYGSPAKANQIGAIGYLARMWLWSHGIPMVCVAPLTLKKYVLGQAKGKREKNLIIREVYRRWNHEAEDDDQADALVLLHIGLSLLGIEQPEIKPQVEVLTALRKKNAERLERFQVVAVGM